MDIREYPLINTCTCIVKKLITFLIHVYFITNLLFVFISMIGVVVNLSLLTNTYNSSYSYRDFLEIDYEFKFY